METPIFYEGFEKGETFYVRYDLDNDLDLDQYVELNFQSF